MIRPPRRHFVFSYIHGISWADVEAQPTFIEVWDQFVPFWKDADYFLAHNAPFDRNVLTACCSAARRRPPRAPFICTVRVARSHWNFRPANLPTVCTQLGISLKHHDAASDALACASIALRAMKEGFPIHSAAVGPRSRWHRRRCAAAVIHPSLCMSAQPPKDDRFLLGGALFRDLPQAMQNCRRGR